MSFMSNLLVCVYVAVDFVQLTFIIQGSHPTISPNVCSYLLQKTVSNLEASMEEEVTLAGKSVRC
jgi:hypothetical protein